MRTEPSAKYQSQDCPRPLGTALALERGEEDRPMGRAWRIYLGDLEDKPESTTSD